jgi:hypothetical protein
MARIGRRWTRLARLTAQAAEDTEIKKGQTHGK